MITRRATCLLALLLCTGLGGCGLFDNNPWTVFRYDPVKWSNPLTPSEPGVMELDLDGRLDVHILRIELEQPDFIAVHERRPGGAEDLRALLSGFGLAYDAVSASPPYQVDDAAAGREVVLARARAWGEPGEPVLGIAEAGVLDPAGVGFPRGWAWIDVDAGAQAYRIVSTRMDTAAFAPDDAGFGAAARQVLPEPAP